jgi:hypothetical protein
MNALRAALLSNPWALASIMSGYLWGFALLAPGDTLARPTYRHMHEISGEWVWTFVFLSVATLQLWRIFCRSNRRTFPYEYTLKWLAAILWSFVGLACMIAQWPLAAAMADTLVVALFSWVDLARIKPCKGCPEAGRCQGDCVYGRS